MTTTTITHRWLIRPTADRYGRRRYQPVCRWDDGVQMPVGPPCYSEGAARNYIRWNYDNGRSTPPRVVEIREGPD